MPRKEKLLALRGCRVLAIAELGRPSGHTRTSVTHNIILPRVCQLTSRAVRCASASRVQGLRSGRSREHILLLQRRDGTVCSSLREAVSVLSRPGRPSFSAPMVRTSPRAIWVATLPLR